MDTYVLYENSTGDIKGSGLIDLHNPGAHDDTSTPEAYVNRMLTKHPGWSVVYRAVAAVANPETEKVVGKKIVKMTGSEIIDRKRKRPKSPIEKLEDRIVELEKKVK